jgi:hypothetical protein
VRRQSDIEKTLRSGEAVPDGEIFGDSTRSTPHVQLNRIKKKFETEGDNTVVRLQCYRLDQCRLPAGLKRSPVLYRFATTLKNSTALSKDQLAERVWPYGAGDTDVWNAVDRLRDDWSLNVVSTGYRQMVIKISDDVVSTATEQTAVNADAPRPISLPRLICQSFPLST